MRRAARIDDNQEAIVAALRKCGCRVLSLAPMGQGVPDLLVAHGTRMMLAEVKNGAKPKCRQKLTKSQEEFHGVWGLNIVVIRSVDEIEELLRLFFR
ncbi:MAG: hypothetical protein ACYCVY_13425 [Acidiferrobacteraceae bacterium]